MEQFGDLKHFLKCDEDVTPATRIKLLFSQNFKPTNQISSYYNSDMDYGKLKTINATYNNNNKII